MQPKCAFTEFCQGKTMRWGVAWTFSPTMNLLDAEPSLLKLKQEEKRLHKPVPFKLQVRVIFAFMYGIDRMYHAPSNILPFLFRFQQETTARPRSNGSPSG